MFVSLIYRVHHQNPDKFQFKFSAILCLRRKSCCWHPRKSDASNKYILKIAARLKPSAEYNRRSAIIEDLHAGRNRNNSLDTRDRL